MAFGGVDFGFHLRAKEIPPSALQGKGASWLPFELQHRFVSGSDDWDLSKIFQARYQLAGAGTQAFDLTASLTDFFGQQVTFTEVTHLLVWNLGTVAHSFGPTAGAGFGVGSAGFFSDISDRMIARPKSGRLPGFACLFAPAGVAVGGATESLTLTNLDGAVAGDVWVAILGR